MLADDVTHTDEGSRQVAGCPRATTVSRFPACHPPPPPRFRMKCHLCVNYIEMQTDPANCDLRDCGAAPSARRSAWDMEDNEQVLTTGEPLQGGLDPNPGPQPGS